jgi:hypothetical protein
VARFCDRENIMRKLGAPIRPAFTSALALAALVTASCVLVDNPSYCDTSADCTDPARSYCDIEGVTAGVRNRCIPEPEGSRTTECGADAPVCDPARIDQGEASNVNEDIDGEMRSQGLGDIGADEWVPE